MVRTDQATPITRHRHVAPSPVLQPFIKCFHVLEIEGEEATQPFERFTPDGCFEVNFNLGERPTRRDASGIECAVDAAYTVARSSHCYFMRGASQLRLIGVRFFPWGLHPFTRVPLSYVADSAVPNTELFGPAMVLLHERLALAPDMDHAMAWLNDHFLKLLADQHADDLVIDAAQRLATANGPTHLEDFTTPYGISQRRFQQRFKQHIGQSARSFTRLMRFQQALRHMTVDPSTPQVQLALDTDHYDQSHFVNEFRAFAGISPKAYLAEAHPLNDAAVLSQVQERA